VVVPPQISENVDLATLTTLGIGGPARYFVEAFDRERLRFGLGWAAEHGLPVFVLGGGSNVIIADDGFPGLVVRISLRDIEAEESGADVLVRAAAGEEWDRFVARCVQTGLAGIECLSGIPGRVGATPIQNVGAYGQEVADAIVDVEALDRTSLKVRWFSHAECGFGYRDSGFKRELADRYVILSVLYRLRHGDPAPSTYSDLAFLTADAGGAVSLTDVREAILAVRRRKGMVVNPDDPDTRSAGSFFLNPVLDEIAYETFRELARRGPERYAEIPSFPGLEGTKLSAAWLIEHSGFSRGYRHGRVGISTKHALAIVNSEDGSAREVYELARSIQVAVRERFGVELVPEPRFVGFEEGAM